MALRTIVDVYKRQRRRRARRHCIRSGYAFHQTHPASAAETRQHVSVIEIVKIINRRISHENFQYCLLYTSASLAELPPLHGDDYAEMEEAAGEAAYSGDELSLIHI